MSISGEEFEIVLFNTDKKLLVECLKNVNKNIESLNIEHKNSIMSNVVTMSIGTIIYEQNLYKSKHNGRNRFTIET